MLPGGIPARRVLLQGAWEPRFFFRLPPFEGDRSKIFGRWPGARGEGPAGRVLLQGGGL